LNLFTDNIDFGNRIWPQQPEWNDGYSETFPENIRAIINEVYQGRGLRSAAGPKHPLGRYAFLFEFANDSHYDLVIEMLRRGITIPHGTIFIADSGNRFHGLREREWAALSGNIHLVVFLAPNRPVKNYGIGFTIIAAVSVVQAIDRISGLKGRAQTKWVNDIVIEGAKVCGVLTHTQVEGEVVTGAVLGIGLNVERTPKIEPSIFVPKAAALGDFVSAGKGVMQRSVLVSLLDCLKVNYDYLVGGDYNRLVDFYRERSAILGKEVQIYPDSPFDKDCEVISGRVDRIGENLELYLEGKASPIIKGRLAFNTRSGLTSQ